MVDGSVTVNERLLRRDSNDASIAPERSTMPMHRLRHFLASTALRVLFRIVFFAKRNLCLKRTILGSNALRWRRCGARSPAWFISSLYRWGYGAARTFTLEEQKFDFIFLDNRLPDGYGLDLIPEACENAPFVIFFSSDAHDEDLAADATRRGARGILKKPFLPNEVLEFLNGRNAIL